MKKTEQKVVKEFVKKEEAPKVAVKTQNTPQTPVEKPVTPPVTNITSKEENVIEGKADQLKGLTVLGKIELPSQKKKVPVASSATTIFSGAGVTGVNVYSFESSKLSPSCPNPFTLDIIDVTVFNPAINVIGFVKAQV